jgi:APA family basic amino acid/polyamine antiporter
MGKLIQLKKQAYKLPGGYAIPIIGLFLCFWLIAQSNTQSWVVVGVLFVSGWIFYAIENYSKKA